MPYIGQKLQQPLRITAYTVEGKPIGYFTSFEVSPQGLYIQGDIPAFFEALRLVDSPLVILDIHEARKRAIRATARANLFGTIPTGPKAKTFLRFVRLGGEHKRRFYKILYGDYW